MTDFFLKYQVQKININHSKLEFTPMKSKSFEKKVREFELELNKLNPSKSVASLFDKEHLLYEIFLSIPLAVSINRFSNGNFIQVNDNFLNLTGLEKNEVIGKNPTEIPINFNYKKPDKIVEKLTNGEQISEVEFEITNKKGNKIIVLASLKPIAFKGEKLICTTYRDITEQVNDKKNLIESEEKFKLIFEKSIAPAIIADDHGNYLNANKAVANLFGYSIAELKQMSVGDIITESRSKNQVLYEDYIKKGKDIGEFDFVTKDGLHKTVVYHAVRIKPDFNLSIMTDTTEQKRISEELLKEKLRAEEAMNSKQLFLSNMSHEIRTPLNSIIGFTNVLLKTDLTDTQKEYLEAVQTSGNFLNVLINDILDLSKVDAGKMTFVNEPFEIEKSIKSMLKSFELDLRQKNLKLIIDYQENIPKIVSGDSIRLNQILTNLIGNAIKFTHEGSITVSVKIESENNEKLSLEIAISDTGIGIEESKIQTIFKLFEQAEINTSNLYGGTGLGLAIVKSLVESQDGKISVESKIGVGSTFKFILPFQKTNVEFLNNNTVSKQLKNIENIKVLVVEDGAINRLLAKVILTNFGFKHDLATNGKMAIEQLQNNHYDIILMDIQMPEMNGFEATEHIRKTMKLTIPIIALTADVTSADFQKCKELGMNDYISKPIDENQLHSKIMQFIKM
uniref:PAS domain S-box protein n=2 Tax=Flavobacterium sp. TaxID=239 RepID=UPI00404A11AD